MESAYRQIADLDERLGSRMTASRAAGPPDDAAESWAHVQ